MTNGEKIKEIFPNLEISPDPYSPSVDICVGGIMMMRVDRNWWNAEYKEPQSFKWCTDCKEYDQEKHCCHRWSKVIRDTVKEMKQESFINKPCVSSEVCEYDKNKVLDKLDEIITDALDKSTDQKESQTLRWVLDKISEVIEDGNNN